VLTPNVYIREKDVKTNNEKGFTLIEVAVVLVLILVLVGAAIPKASSYIQSYNYSSDIRTMISVINKARSKSIQTGAPTAISFQANNGVGDASRARYVAFVDNGEGGGTAGDGIQNGEEKIFADVLMHGAVVIGPINFNNALNGGQTVAFNSQGFAMGLIGGAPAVFNGTIPTSTRTKLDSPSITGVTIDLSGYAHINKP
jgi:prepilin-type N-terminal cleavage/methylation domain-containing protein